MSKAETGGTAYPMQDPQAIHAYAAARIEGITDPAERDRLYTLARAEAVTGMTLRDRFAVDAMRIHLAEHLHAAASKELDLEPGWRDFVADNAYLMADAMLRARSGEVQHG
ncbi:hypothetical protein RAN3_2493 [plant metagenome]|uniref:Uncharacterized protein n=1 Tax=plant metagenome TaxID=1297885 RepID=A0A484U4R0_9ZZZZ